MPLLVAGWIWLLVTWLAPSPQAQVVRLGASIYVQSAEPSAALLETGHFWFDTNTGVLKVATSLGPTVWTTMGSGGAAAWGDITGTLGNQADLSSALGGKAPTSHGHAQADVTSLVSDLAGKAATAYLATLP